MKKITLLAALVFLVSCSDDSSSTKSSLNWDSHCDVKKTTNTITKSIAAPNHFTIEETMSYEGSVIKISAIGEFNTDLYSCNKVSNDYPSTVCIFNCSNGSFTAECTNDLTGTGKSAKALFDENYEDVLEECAIDGED